MVDTEKITWNRRKEELAGLWGVPPEEVTDADVVAATHKKPTPWPPQASANEVRQDGFMDTVYLRRVKLRVKDS